MTRRRQYAHHPGSPPLRWRARTATPPHPAGPALRFRIAATAPTQTNRTRRSHPADRPPSERVSQLPARYAWPSAKARDKTREPAHGPARDRKPGLARPDSLSRVVSRSDYLLARNPRKKKAESAHRTPAFLPVPHQRPRREPAGLLAQPDSGTHPPGRPQSVLPLRRVLLPLRRPTSVVKTRPATTIAPVHLSRPLTQSHLPRHRSVQTRRLHGVRQGIPRRSPQGARQSRPMRHALTRRCSTNIMHQLRFGDRARVLDTARQVLHVTVGTTQYSLWSRVT